MTIDLKHLPNWLIEAASPNVHDGASADVVVAGPLNCLTQLAPIHWLQVRRKRCVGPFCRMSSKEARVVLLRIHGSFAPELKEPTPMSSKAQLQPRSAIIPCCFESDGVFPDAGG